MMRKMLSCFLLVLAVTAVQAGVYTVDPSGSGDYTSFDAGVDAMTPGDTLYVEDGVYREAVTLSQDGTAGNPIVIKSRNPLGAVVDGSQLITGWAKAPAADPNLTVLGVTNTNITNIYKATVDEADIDDIYAALLFENREHLFIAQYPDQVGKAQDIIQDKDHFILVSPEAHGQTTYILDTDFLGAAAGTQPVSYAGSEEAYQYAQPDDYWNGGQLLIHSHGINNHIAFMEVTDFDAAAHTLTFSPALGADITSGSREDSYTIRNHPHVLSAPGEYYIVPAASDGKYSVYLWPRNEANLADGISFAMRDRGIYGYAKKHVIVDGFEVTGHTGDGIRFRGAASATNTVNVKNCYVHRNVGWGIYLNFTVRCTVENNDVLLCTGNSSRGIHLTNGTLSCIKGNSASRTGSTNLSYYNTTNSSIIGNRALGAGTHGNGLSCYLDCDSILIAHNIFFVSNTGITLQDFGHFTVFGNLFYPQGTAQQLNNWGGDSKGPVFIAQNTILTANGNYVMSVQTDGLPVYSYNNILHGDNSRLDADHADTQPGVRKNNYYTEYGWTQSSSYGWTLDPSEIDGRSADWNTVFTDTTARNFNLLSSSPVRGAGMDLSGVLDSLGIAAIHPTFDFTKDMNGNDWGSTPSIGCFEYTTSTVTPYGVPADVRPAVFVNPVGHSLLVTGPDAAAPVAVLAPDGTLLCTGVAGTQLHTAHLEAGVYLVRVGSGAGAQWYKMIKAR